MSGAVPDADDTPAALLALSYVRLEDPQFLRLRYEVCSAVAAGLRWLWKLQNRDGGWPTFCRGWGKLPFDRSGTDLTAHALRAFHAWLPRLDEIRAGGGVRPPSRRQLQAAMRRGLDYLGHTQQSDGSWLPLWFGNQDRSAEDNPIYGTGKVLLAFEACGELDGLAAVAGIRYLKSQQNRDGGWGGGPSVSYRHSVASGDSEGRAPDSMPQTHSTVEETAIALEGLLCCGGDPRQDPSIMRGLHWLADVVQQGHLGCSWPIGFYFAKLWYHERLYPTVFSLGAIGAALHSMNETKPPRPGSIR